MKCYYVIPPTAFFTQGRGGAVSHSVGLFSGYLENPTIEPRIDGCNNVSSYFHESYIEKGRRKPKGSGALKDLINSVSIILFYSRVSGCIVHIRKNWAVVLAGFILFPCVSRMAKNNKLVFEINGLSFEGNAGLLGRLLFRVSAHFTVRVVSKAKLVYVVSEDIKRNLVAFSPKMNMKISVIPNGSPNYIGRPSVLHSGVDFVFYGKFRAYNEYDIVRAAFNEYRLKDASARLFFVGFGPEESCIREVFSGCENVTFLGAHSLEEIKETGIFNREVTIGLVPVGNYPGSSYLSPIKLYDYFSLGWPAVVSDVISMDAELSMSPALMKYEAGNYRSLASSLRKMVDACLASTEVGRSVEKVAHENSWKRRAANLLEIISD